MNYALITPLTALTGTVIGGATSLMSTRWSYEAQRRRSQRAAARLVLSELRTNCRAVQLAVQKQDLGGLKEGPPSVRQWERHQGVLGEELSQVDWDIVELAASAMAGVHHIVTRPGVATSLGEENERIFSRCLDRSVTALGVLRASLDGASTDPVSLGREVLAGRVSRA